MFRDPIVEEVRKVRREIEAACDNDWDKLFDYYLNVQKELSKTHKIVSGSPKPLVKAQTGS